MKKFLSTALAALLLIGLCAFASADTAQTSSFRIAAPGGAPALALATLAKEHPEQYTFVAAETITAEFSSGASDFIIAPLNAGAKLFKAGKSAYRLAAVVSWGNLFFASQRENFTLDDINGAEITLFGENTINSSIALYVLEHSGIKPATVSYLGSAANTQQLLLSDENAIVLTAEPALTAACMKNDRVFGFSVNDLYEKATGYPGFTQAGLFVRGDVADSAPGAVDAYLAEVAASCAKCTGDVSAVAEAAVALEILPNAKVAARAIPNCAIRYLAAPEAREQVEITAGIDLTQFGGALPADEFYYGAK